MRREYDGSEKPKQKMMKITTSCESCEQESGPITCQNMLLPHFTPLASISTLARISAFKYPSKGQQSRWAHAHMRIKTALIVYVT